jgi:hypothetical protein
MALSSRMTLSSRMAWSSRMWWVAVAGTAAIAVTGCGQAQRPAGNVVQSSDGRVVASGDNVWREPHSYVYIVDSRCGERLLIGRIRLWVGQGKVVRAEGVDESGRRLATEAKLANLPTLGQLLDEYDKARHSDADVATVAFDPGDGHPTKIDLDPNKNAIDDEACYVISEYAVLSTPPPPS